MKVWYVVFFNMNRILDVLEHVQFLGLVSAVISVLTAREVSMGPKHILTDQPHLQCRAWSV